MKGTVLDYSVQNNTGIINGNDGLRYTFIGSEWHIDSIPEAGTSVDFVIRETNAIDIYINSLGEAECTTASGSIDKTTAGLLALFLGAFGAHKLYMGRTGPALVYLLTNTVGVMFTWIFLFLPNITLLIFAVVEAVIYLTMTDENFEQTYVSGKRNWF
jgi:TM2 domain-containing membrane protein YozV